MYSMKLYIYWIYWIIYFISSDWYGMDISLDFSNWNRKLLHRHKKKYICTCMSFLLYIFKTEQIYASHISNRQNSYTTASLDGSSKAIADLDLIPRYSELQCQRW